MADTAPQSFFPEGFDPDIAVIGLGAEGLSALLEGSKHHLVGHRARMAGIEAGKIGERAASAKNAGLLGPDYATPVAEMAARLIKMRQAQGADPKEAGQEVLPKARRLMALSMEGCMAFRAAAEECRAGKITDGVLSLICREEKSNNRRKETKAKATALRRMLTELHIDYGLDPLPFLTEEEIRTQIGCAENIYACGYSTKEVGGGSFEAVQVYSAMMKQLRRKKIPLFHECKATKITREGEKLRVHTNRGHFQTRLVFMANAFAKGINPEVMDRVIFYHPHAFIMDVHDHPEILAGAAAIEDDDKPSYYAVRRGDFVKLGYFDTLGNARWDSRYARRKTSARTAQIFPQIRDTLHERIVGERSARLSMSSNGLPDFSEKDGVFTGTGLSDRGNALAIRFGQMIMREMLARLGYEIPAWERENYRLVEALPKGPPVPPDLKPAHIREFLQAAF